MKSILQVKKFLGLVEMTSGLVNARFSLPKWQAVRRGIQSVFQWKVWLLLSKAGLEIEKFPNWSYK